MDIEIIIATVASSLFITSELLACSACKSNSILQLLAHNILNINSCTAPQAV